MSTWGSGTCVCSAVPRPAGRLPEGRVAQPATLGMERQQETEPPPDRSPVRRPPPWAAAAETGGTGPADRPPPNQPVSTEDPAGAPHQGCAWRLGLEGVPATWLPLACGCWYCWERGVSWTPTLLSAFPPHDPASSGGGAQTSGFRLWGLGPTVEPGSGCPNGRRYRWLWPTVMGPVWGQDRQMWTVETGGKPEGGCGQWRWGRMPEFCKQVGEMCAVTSEEGVTWWHRRVWVVYLGWAPHFPML